MELHKVRMMRIVPALLFPFVTCWLQWQFWSIFKPFVWFLFFPTVFFSSRIGGKYVGIVSTVVSALLVVYFFIPPQLSFADKHNNNLYSVVVFLVMGILFSYTHDRLERAKRRTAEAQEDARMANEQLQEARICRLQAEQKLTQEHLHWSEHRFRSIFNSSPIAIGIGRRDDGRIVEVNDAWLKMFGFELDEVIGRTTAELKLYARDDERNEIVRIIHECGRVINREIQLRRKSGDIIDVLGSAEIIELGGESFLQVMTTDITEQKRNEVAREATVELLQICNKAASLPELMQDLMHYFQKLTGCEAIGIRLADGDDFPYYVTRGFSEEFVQAEKCLCAYDQEGELIRDHAGHPSLDCMCGNILCGRIDPSKSFFSVRGSFWSSCTTELLANTSDADRQAKTRNRCNGEGYESVALIPLRNRDETYGLFQFNDREKGRFSAEKIALYEDLVDFVAIALTKLKSEQALRESEQFSLQIISNAEEGIVVYGSDLRYRGWNPYMERMSGLAAQEVIGKHPLELFPFLKDAGVIEQLEINLAGQPVCSTEFPLHSPYNDYTGWVSDTSSPLKNADGEIIGVIGMVHDITARKQAEKALQEKHSEMERFIYMISHDLKSPLVTVNTFLGYLEQDMANRDAERITKDLDYIRTASERMGQMLDELLELSRIGRKVNAPQGCSFLELAELARKLVAGRISERGIEVRVGGDDVALYGDCARLLEIWQNLLENACKFIGDRSHPLIKIGAEGCGRETVFFVCDNGIGIEPHHQDKIFGLFEKLDRNSQGTGLGLALVRRIVELYGGKIRVESQGAGQGACFRFTLPEAIRSID